MALCVAAPRAQAEGEGQLAPQRLWRLSRRAWRGCVCVGRRQWLRRTEELAVERGNVYLQTCERLPSQPSWVALAQAMPQRMAVGRPLDAGCAVDIREGRLAPRPYCSGAGSAQSGLLPKSEGLEA